MLDDLTTVDFTDCIANTLFQLLSQNGMEGLTIQTLHVSIHAQEGINRTIELPVVH